MESFDLISYIKGGIFFGLLGIVTTYIAFRLSFFRISPLPYHFKQPIRYFFLGTLAYPLVFFFSASCVLSILWKIKNEIGLFLFSSPLLLITASQLITLSCLFLFLVFFSAIQKKTTLKAIWKDRALSPSSLFFDFILGVLTWVICFPIVASLSKFFEICTYLLFKTTGEEQLAVRYLKAVLSSPTLLTIAILCILVIAPIIEETAFRGYLQTFLKQKIGLKKAVILSAAIFSLFHFSLSQGVGNISLVPSIFIFSLYLGFLYERQHSLIAPITLHMTFNSITVMRILLLHT